MPDPVKLHFKNHLIRNFDAGERLEMFFVTAITSIFIIRLFLALTGYPSLGNSDFHIAHMLWGGLFMVSGLMLRIVFIGRTAERWTVILGGVGFGTFIDEIGKFITRDNNYFFHPAPAIIYMTFIIIVLSVRLIFRKHYSQNEYLLNALKITGEITLNNGSIEDKKQALKYLEQSDPSNSLVQVLHKSLTVNSIFRKPKRGLLTHVKTVLHRAYTRLVRFPGFNFLVILFFSFQLLSKFIYLFVIVFLKGFKIENILKIRFLESIAINLNSFSFIEWAEFSSTLLSAFVVFWGFLELKKRLRYNAYILFERSVLINIFITQFFIFYQDQFGAVAGLLANLFLLAALKFMIHREQHLSLSKLN